MTHLGDIWRIHAQTAGVLEDRPDFRLDPVLYAERAGISVSMARVLRVASLGNLPGNLYSALRLEIADLDSIVEPLITDPELRAAIDAGVDGAIELGFELIRLGNPVDRKVSRFSIERYLNLHPDVGQAGVEPFLHYIRFGAQEGRAMTANVDRHEGALPRMPHRPTCLIVVHEMSRTGAPIVGRDIAREAAKTHNVVIAALRGGDLLDDFRATACDVIVTGQPQLDFRLLDDDPLADVDFAIINSVETSPFIPLLVGREIPFLSYLHEYADYTFPAYKLTFMALFSDLMVFSSEHVRDSWAGALADVTFDSARDSIIVPQRPVLRETVSAEAIAAARAQLSAMIGRDLSDVRLVCGAGHVQWRKGTDIFCMAAQIAAARDPDCVFLWIGDGLDAEDVHFGVWMSYHMRQIGANDPAGNLFFIPAGPAYLDVMRASDAMLLSSRLDPLPNVVFDAVRLGCKVVLFDGGSGFGDARYADDADFVAVEYANPAAAVDALLALPRKTAVGDRPTPETKPLFQTLSDALRDRLDSQRYFVRGASDFDMPVLFSTKDEDRALRVIEREKMMRYRRRFLWRDLEDARTTLAASENWAHKRSRITDYATVKAEEVPPFSIHVHAYYTDELADDLANRAAFRRAQRIVVTTDTARKADEITDIFAREGLTAEVVETPNRGRDILPFMNLFVADGLAGTDDIWCHIHQKKSLTSTSGGDVWRRFLLNILLGQGGALSNAFSLIGQPGTGLVAPFDPHCVSWTKSRSFLPWANARLPEPLPDSPLVFPVGNMFLVRAEVVRQMNALFGAAYPWPNEPIANDGTEFHFIERLWPAMAARCGLDSVFVHKPDEIRL